MTPLVGYYLYESGKDFDVGVALYRSQLPDGSQISSDELMARMAFASNGEPAQADSAIVNGVTLQWSTDSANTMYFSEDSGLYGAPDSMTFAYKNFEGESFTSNLPVSTSFGKVTFPDTVSAAAGFTISYEHSNPRDSLKVLGDAGVVSFALMLPDTGSFTIPPNFLIYISGVTVYFRGYRFLRNKYLSNSF